MKLDELKNFSLKKLMKFEYEHKFKFFWQPMKTSFDDDVYYSDKYY